MNRHRSTSSVVVALLLTLGIAALSSVWVPSGWAGSTRESLTEAEAHMPLFDNLGDYQQTISTQSEYTQQYFNQGMIFAYGFNHAEAARSFQAAIRHDATCALCYWGLAYVLGPNINAPMELGAVSTAWEAIRQAQALKDNATPQEQALIEAMASRYVPDAEGDRATLDQAYADAMVAIYHQYPDDPDIATLYAEALMNTMPWHYWEEDGSAKPATAILLATLEAVLERHPDHLGALHLYIHAVEKERPELAEKAADALRNLAPGVGHLIHMPSHIYIRIGRYHDAVIANQQAVAVDQAYLQGPHTASLYTFAYMPHNHHFEWFGALMTGQREIALAAAKHTAEVDLAMMHEPDLTGALQHFYAVPLYTLVRFERWNDILTTPAPAADLKYARGIWHYAQGMAQAAQGDVAQARQHLEIIQTLVADPAVIEQSIWGFNKTSQVLKIAASELAGKVALAEGRLDEAIAALQQAGEQEKQLVYTEPPDWYAPTQNLLGRGLFKAQRYEEAAAAFQADLAAYPENGWSLFGLAQSLRAQGKTAAAAAIQARFAKAWQYADTPIPFSL